MKGLLKSRKFWMAVLDAGVSTLTVALALFLQPQAVDDVLKVVLIWQPVVALVIVGITVEDAQALKAGTHPNQTDKG